MKVILQREYEDEFGTHGNLSLNGEFLCYTLEEPWRGNMRRVSCVPSGDYECVKHNGSFKNVWRLLDVPNRTAVLIHSGNTLADTEGCILVGMSFGEIKGKPAVLQSQDALDMLRRKLPKEFTLQVIDP